MLRMRGITAARRGLPPRRASIRAAVAFVATIALLTTGGLASAAHATPESELSAERARAEQLQAEIEANGNQVSILDEQYNRAQAAIERATEQLNADQAQLEAKARETDRIR